MADSSSSTPSRARRAVAHAVASRATRIDASRHHAATMMEMIKETTTDDGDDGRARRRRARVRETVARIRSSLDASIAVGGRARASCVIIHS